MKYVVENLFGIDGWNIAWYGVIIACGMILGVILASVRARQDGLKSDMLLDFMLFATPIAILCARAYYVIFEWESYADNLWSAFKIWEGGLAIYGGVIGGLLTAVSFCRYHHFPLMRFLIEGLRTDSLHLFPGLRISQLLSLVLMCVGIFLWFWGVQKDKFTTEYRGKYRFS